MKKIFLLLIIALFGLSSASAQNNKIKNDPVGKWLYEAPTAPEVYATGSIEVLKSEDKYTVTFSVTGSEFKLPAEKVVVANDSLKFILYLDDEQILFGIKIVDGSKMTGKAFHSEGEVSMSFFREEKKE